MQPTCRRAVPDDADRLAELINFAGEGLPHYLWSKMAQSGETAWDVGRRRARREEGGFSYRNAWLLQEDGRAVACLIGYPLPDAPEPVDRGSVPAMFVPLLELEALVPGSWYVNVLATYPEHRGRGCGTALLGVAERLAVEAGRRRLSVIVADANAGARRLYARCGYRVLAQRPMAKDGWQSPSENWVLMAKEI